MKNINIKWKKNIQEWMNNISKMKNNIRDGIKCNKKSCWNRSKVYNNNLRWHWNRLIEKLRKNRFSQN